MLRCSLPKTVSIQSSLERELVARGNTNFLGGISLHEDKKPIPQGTLQEQGPLTEQQMNGKWPRGSGLCGCPLGQLVGYRSHLHGAQGHNPSTQVAAFLPPTRLLGRQKGLWWPQSSAPGAPLHGAKRSRLEPQVSFVIHLHTVFIYLHTLFFIVKLTFNTRFDAF